MPAAATLEAVLAAFHHQIAWCERLGSGFTAQLLTGLSADLRAGGPTAATLEDWPGDPVADALPLRIAAALHALVLLDQVPELAAVYPPHPAPEPPRLRSTVVRALETHQPFVAEFLTSPPQTNEVGRSAVLLGGFLEIAQETRLPLRLLEVGASAGLNSNWDRYRYRLGPGTWGDPHSPVTLSPEWHGAAPPLDAPLRVASRQACDRAPIDLADTAQRLRLRAFVWADQPERLARLDQAIGLARAHAIRVENADAAAWVRDRLREPSAGAATVLVHSIMWQYLPVATQDEILACLKHKGARATTGAPLAWLRFEPDRPEHAPELRLTSWPPGRERRLASAHPHGSRVCWSAG